MTSTARIKALNDMFRSTLLGGKVFLTEGVNAEDAAFKQAVIEGVMNFDAFTKGNDPYGEHDFGAFTVNGRKLFWKIDYYDHSMQFGSEDPANAEITTRVLTIMLAEEF